MVNEKLLHIIEPIATEYNIFLDLFQNEFKSDNQLLDNVLHLIAKRPGKFLRPILVMLVAKLMNNSVSDATYHSALSLELLHTASLVHDDVVDESLLRRGQPSVNSSFNNKVSVLVGDYLLSRSLYNSAKTGKIKIVNAISELGSTLSLGEIIQLDNIGADSISEDIYYKIIEKKTAVLFAFSAVCGSLSVDASEEKCAWAYELGKNIGMAFQIKDDSFDFHQDATIGKPTSNDLKEGKLTLPAIHFVHQNKDCLPLVEKIRSLNATDEEIGLFSERVRNSSSMDYANDVMNSYYEKAKSLLSVYANQPIAKSVLAYMSFVIRRDF